MLKLVVLIGLAAGALAVTVLKEPSETEPEEIDEASDTPLKRAQRTVKQRIHEARVAARQASKEKEAEVIQAYEETVRPHE